jgi:hypothetical protein
MDFYIKFRRIKANGSNSPIFPHCLTPSPTIIQNNNYCSVSVPLLFQEGRRGGKASYKKNIQNTNNNGCPCISSPPVSGGARGGKAPYRQPFPLW